jgi:mannose-6-phosphate isomerase-like protein (cupin superfamily)
MGKKLAIGALTAFLSIPAAAAPEIQEAGHERLSESGMAMDVTTMKRGYADDIERATLKNEDFRRVLYTGQKLQLVLMTLQPGEEIGEEVHPDRDQFFRIEEGAGAIDIDGRENKVEDDFAIIVPAGVRHNVRNTGSQPLRLYTIYAPPEHKDGIVQKTKAEAEARHEAEEWDGKTTEQ